MHCHMGNLNKYKLYPIFFLPLLKYRITNPWSAAKKFPTAFSIDMINEKDADRTIFVTGNRVVAQLARRFFVNKSIHRFSTTKLFDLARFGER